MASFFSRVKEILIVCELMVKPRASIVVVPVCALFGRKDRRGTGLPRPE